ncbi:MAG: chemotaxis response regulator protein-glutamate methylesterase [Gammaproteobacteria bacterium]|nr:chemotaxis response regulator protein-glutamate methylesterase [Gammaproteobacteria bacterium]
MKRVLVIDDSALMRRQLSEMLQQGGYEVQIARNGEEGLSKIETFDPAVVTLDLNMPVMDGMTCLSLIMQQCPRPVVMVSSLTEKGALATFEALELGAVDYLAKPGGTVSVNLREVKKELLSKVKAASMARLSRPRSVQKRPSMPVKSRPVLQRPPPVAGQAAEGVVLIGVSTGGPRTLEEVICALPADFPLPILVAQHMPASFTRLFAERLNKLSPLQIQELDKPTPLQAGTVLIAKGNADMKVIRRSGRLMACLTPERAEFLWHPSVEYLAQSLQQTCDPKQVIAVQLTGMGSDGAEAMTQLHKQGARTIAESEQTAVVYGMPRELVERGGAELVLPCDKIAAQLIRWAEEMPSEQKQRRMA